MKNSTSSIPMLYNINQKKERLSIRSVRAGVVLKGVVPALFD